MANPGQAHVGALLPLFSGRWFLDLLAWFPDRLARFPDRFAFAVWPAVLTERGPP
jgi:hypothetical protein